MMTPFLNLTAIRERLAPRERRSAMAEWRRLDRDAVVNQWLYGLAGAVLGVAVAAIIYLFL